MEATSNAPPSPIWLTPEQWQRLQELLALTPERVERDLLAMLESGASGGFAERINEEFGKLILPQMNETSEAMVGTLQEFEKRLERLEGQFDALLKLSARRAGS